MIGKERVMMRLSMRMCSWLMLCVLFIRPWSASAQDANAPKSEPDRLEALVNDLASDLEDKVIAWRRDIHQYPELSNREFRTAKLVADHLRALNLEVTTGVAHTGVVGILRGGSGERVVALRADMDALPVTEAVDLPFASTVRANYNGQEVGVMHACGHDAHTAILMGVAEVLSKVADRLPGTVKFIFQPAEEGAPAGEEGGAELMIREGVFDDPRPSAIFGLHVVPLPAGLIGYRSGPALASSDRLRIIVRGRQTHGAVPWRGVDPITVASQIVTGLQTIVSRQVDLTVAPAVISLGRIEGGVRENIIPDEVQMLGTIRALHPEGRELLHLRIRNTAEKIAESAGATAEVIIDKGYPVTVNDANLTEAMVPVLQRVFGKSRVIPVPPLTVAEDFSFYQQQVPGMFYLLGITPPGISPADAPPNHSPHFCIDESALVVGVRSLSHLALAHLSGE
jgi:amidohydrolase